jgi:hypothetical protein
MSTPKPGDKVRVTYEAVWDQDRGTHYWLRDLTDGTTASVPNTATVEVIRPADDPSKDPVGTVRTWHDGPYVRSDLDPRYPWIPLHRDGGNHHRDMIGREIIGAVPGTPAAEAQKLKLRVFKDDSNDLWFEIEPDCFTYGLSREDAERYHQEDDSAYSRWSLTKIRRRYETATEVPEP